MHEIVPRKILYNNVFASHNMFDGVDTLLVDVSGLILPRPSVLSQLSPVTRSQCAGQLASVATGGTRAWELWELWREAQ